MVQYREDILVVTLGAEQRLVIIGLGKLAPQLVDSLDGRWLTEAVAVGPDSNNGACSSDFTVSLWIIKK
jgi:hypothetical protein